MEQKHNHKKCNHEKLKWCEICDVIYCENPDCGEEWKKQYTSWSFTIPYANGTQTFPNYPNETICSHTHKIN
jgi:hypothetical protein